MAGDALLDDELRKAALAAAIPTCGDASHGAARVSMTDPLVIQKEPVPVMVLWDRDLLQKCPRYLQL